MTVLYVVDAFTDRPFAGNPAGVCILETPADESWMRLVAREMNLAETAFVCPETLVDSRADRTWSLRWFTPTVEVALCGHATLASAYVLWEIGVLPREKAASFRTRSGWLTCASRADWIEMDFPAMPASRCEPPDRLVASLGCEPPLWIGFGGMDYLVEVADARALRALKPDLTALAEITCPRPASGAERTCANCLVRGVIVTARSDRPEFDFLSRFFAPAAGVPEDPVTGSAHCTLGPYWRDKLGKQDFLAYQASARGGTVGVSVRGDRVLLRGQAVMMSRVEMRTGPG
jgi:PhzF family phenazine biosynthesis protein